MDRIHHHISVPLDRVYWKTSSYFRNSRLATMTAQYEHTTNGHAPPASHSVITTPHINLKLIHSRSLTLRSFIYHGLMTCTLMSLIACSPPPLLARLDEFRNKITNLNGLEHIQLHTLQQIDPQLLTPDSMHPNFSAHTTNALHELYYYRQHCHGNLNSVAVHFREFELALCTHTPTH